MKIPDSIGLLDDVYQRGARVRCPFEMKGFSISVELILTGEDAGGTNAS